MRQAQRPAQTQVQTRKAICVVGIGDDGCVGLTSRANNAIVGAQVLVGGRRQLAFFPDFKGETIELSSKLGKTLDRVVQAAEENNVCVLASGDPLFFGIGSLIAKRMEYGEVDFIPQPSSIQLAFARAGLGWSDASWISLHGKPLRGVAVRMHSMAKVAVLTDQLNTPQRIARHLVEYGERDWAVHVCERLGGVEERVSRFSLVDLSQRSDEESFDPLNVMVMVRTDTDWRPAPALLSADEDAFAKRMPKQGLITKREVRCLSLAAMRIQEDSVVWDIGAASGSVAIESARIAKRGRVYAVETNRECVDYCEENVRHFGTDNVQVLHGLAPELLDTLESPDAVFVGGTRGSMEAIVRTCLQRLNDGGRLVVNAITLESCHEAYQSFKKLGLIPEVTLVQVSRGAKLAHYLRYEAHNPIHIFSVTKPHGVDFSEAVESA